MTILSKFAIGYSLEWENSGDYDTQNLSGIKFYTVTVNDGDGNPVAIVYGISKEQCRDRAEAIARLPQK